MCHQIIIAIKIITLLLLLLLLLTTCFLVVVLYFEVSEPLKYTKGSHNVYIAKKRTKKARNSDIKKGIYFDQFWKEHSYRCNYCHIGRTLLCMVILAGVFLGLSAVLMSMHRTFLEYLGKQEKENTLIQNCRIFTHTWTMWKATFH